MKKKTFSESWHKTRFFWGMISLWGVGPGHPGQVFTLIFDILKRKIHSLLALPLKNCAWQNPSNCWCTLLDQPQGLLFCKKVRFFKPGMLTRPISIYEMAWRSHWINLLPKKQRNKQKKIFIFFHCFSRISWLHLPKLLRNHCILTKQIFWMIKVGFYIIFFSSQTLTWPPWKNIGFDEKSRNILS